MARIAGIDIPRDKRVVVSLTYIYGIGPTTAKKILAAAGVSEDVRVKDLTEEEETKIRKEVEHIKTEGDLRRETQLNIKRLMEIGCYRGLRIVKDFQYVDRELRLTLERVKVKLLQLLERRSSRRQNKWQNKLYVVKNV